MSNETKTAAVQPAAPAKEKKPSVVDTFLKGCARGFKVGIENITPAMILGYVLVYILQETGLMDLLGVVMSPVMNLFGLPGEAFAVLISAFFAKASGCATAASMYQAGTLTLGQASMMLPACILMGTLIGHYARIVLVTGSNKKWHPLLIVVCLAGRGHQPGDHARHPGDHGHSVSLERRESACPDSGGGSFRLWLCPDRDRHAHRPLFVHPAGQFCTCLRHRLCRRADCRHPRGQASG